MSLEFGGRVAVITGAASGIGAATARVLARRGARVCCADIDLAGAELITHEIVAAGGTAFAWRADVSDPADNRALANEALRRYGSLDLAHLNAGIVRGGPILELGFSDWERAVAVNLQGVFLGLQACGRAMADSGGGSIVITSSGAGLLGSPGGAIYSATKHGVLGLMKCAAIDLAPYGIRVNAVCPGVVDTPIQGSLHGQAEQLLRKWGQLHPIGRLADTDEIARVVAFLLSEESSYMTGSTVAVDGGATAMLGLPAKPKKEPISS
jgi:NAD(P)-dependent dehydrogenase (short-subunit alcohol dehydrogenase family)